MRSISPLLVGLLASLGVASAWAQTPNAQVERSRITGSQAQVGPQAFEAVPTGGGGAPLEAAPSTPGDEDLGQQWILKKNEKLTPFTVFANLSGNATNNVALQRDHGESDTFLLGEVGALWARPIAQNLVADIGARQQFFRYDKFTEFDFDSLNLGAGLSYGLPQLGGIVLTGRYNYTRLTDAREEDEFFTEHTLSIGVQKTFVLSRAQSIFAGYNSEFSLAAEPITQRYHIHSLSLGYNVDLTRALSGQAVYRASLLDYRNIERQDWNQLIALGLTYRVTSWFNVSLLGSYVFNNSNRTEFNYSVGNLSANLGVAVRF